MAVLTTALTAAALITILVVRHVLVNRLDDQLRAAGHRFSVALEHDDHDADNRYGDVEGQLAGTLGARVLHGTVTNAAIVGGRRGHDDDVPTAARAQLARLGADRTPRSVRLTGVGSYRVVVAAGRDGDLQITGLPEAPIQRTIDKLAFVLALVFAVVLVAIVLIATGLLRVMLAPLSRISSTAAEVADLPLETGGVSLPHRVDTGASGSEVDTLARAFNAMLEQVESALRTRADSEDRLRRFIADASHELRTPIAVVRGHAELAQREGGAALGPDVSRSLARIAAQSERMSHLVEDLLLLARLDSGRPLAAEPVDLVRTVLDAVDDARIAAPTHQWRLALPDDVIHVTGDAHALAQVVSNLLSNAAAHTPRRTTVSASLTSAQGRVCLTVADNGPGMPDAVAARAFDRFVRGTGERSTTRGSSGLGLPIVAAIVHAHGGEVGLRTTPAGTTVHVELPVAHPGS